MPGFLILFRCNCLYSMGYFFLRLLNVGGFGVDRVDCVKYTDTFCGTCFEHEVLRGGKVRLVLSRSVGCP